MVVDCWFCWFKPYRMWIDTVHNVMMIIVVIIISDRIHKECVFRIVQTFSTCDISNKMKLYDDKQRRQCWTKIWMVSVTVSTQHIRTMKALSFQLYTLDRADIFPFRLMFGSSNRVRSVHGVKADARQAMLAQGRYSLTRNIHCSWTQSYLYVLSQINMYNMAFTAINKPNDSLVIL